MCKNNNKVINTLSFISALQFIDFILTYVGVNILGVITEANELAIPLLESSYLSAFIQRSIYIIIIGLMLTSLYYIDDTLFLFVSLFAISTNIYIIMLHCSWIYDLFKALKYVWLPTKFYTSIVFIIVSIYLNYKGYNLLYKYQINK